MSSTPHRSALITGASSGIGAALAKYYAAAGAQVLLAARREQALRELADSIEASGGKAQIEVLDVSDPERTEARIRELDHTLGFDLVVANAGIGGSKWGGKLDWADCKGIINVNVSGAIATLTGALPGMIERRAGHLVGISSVAQYRGLPSSAIYCASKAFLSTFLESLRIDLHGTGVSVTDARPGFIDTPLSASLKSKPFEISAEEAAKIIAKAVRRKRGVITFPKQMAAVGHMLEVLPGAIYEPVVRRGRK
ncbi:SDR family NAD(P)-dependent oxidoreductase [Enhygromyxa salina]|nr:SDR family NAD(P)-dependent oxidoreductase [Enhygromyxa salina]